MTYNPKAPNTVGMEWRPYIEGYTQLDSPTKNASFLIDKNSTETIDQLILPHQWTGPSSGYGLLWADVYDLASSPVAGTVTELSFSPSEDKARSNTTQSNFVTTTDLYDQINDADDSSGVDNDYVVNANYGGTGTYRMQFNTGAISSSYRILYVKFEVRLKGFDWSWQQPKLELEWWDNTTQVGSKFHTISPPQDYVFRTHVIGPFYFDFANGGPWLQPEIANFALSNSRHLGLTFRYACAVSRVTMKVGVVAENRVAVGVSARQTVPPSGVQTNLPMSFKTPLNVDNWAATTGKDYLVVVRRCEDPFGTTAPLTPQILYLDSGEANPHGEGNFYDVTLGDQQGLVTAYGASGTRCYAPVLGTSGGAASADSQPYYDVAWKPVTTSSTLKQGVTAASAQAYKALRFVVAVDVASNPDAAMSIKVKKSSDNSQVGGTATLAVAVLADATIATSLGTSALADIATGRTYGLYSVKVDLATAATLATSTDYYVEFTSTGTTPWYVAWADSSASHALTGNNTYGGSSQQATVASTGYPAADFGVSLGSTPSSVTNLAFSKLGLALPNGESFEYAHLTWTATTLSTAFVRYEIERSLDAGVTYVQVATISSESDNDFDDVEVPSGVAPRYRIRAVRNDGQFSDWATVTGTATTAVTVYVFSSNAAPGLTTGFPLIGDTIGYEFLSGAETVFMKMHDRDYQVAFRPLEERGMRVQFTALIHASRSTSPADGTGSRAFESIRAIASDPTVPYVAVLTPDGEQWFGALQITGGARREPHRLYIAQLTFTETQGEPSSVSL